jgi:hypothetical protein
MSELVNVLEECIEIVESDQYLIDKVIMSEKRAVAYVNELRDFLKDFLCKIKTDFADIDNFKYRRIILPTPINSETEGMLILDRETWEVMKSSEYKHRGYEVYLKREK